MQEVFVVINEVIGMNFWDRKKAEKLISHIIKKLDSMKTNDISLVISFNKPLMVTPTAFCALKMWLDQSINNKFKEFKFEYFLDFKYLLDDYKNIY